MQELPRPNKGCSAAAMSDGREDGEEDKSRQRQGRRSGRVTRNRRQRLQQGASVELFHALELSATSSRRRRRSEKAAWSQWGPFVGAGSGPLQLLDDDLCARLEEVEPGDEEKQCIEECTKELQAVCEAASPALEQGSWKIAMFGSAANGFGVRDSDIDVTCLRTIPEKTQQEDEGSGEAAEGKDEREEHEEPEKVLRRWLPLLAEHPRFAVTEEVLFAKVPILKIQFDKRFDIDLSCQNSVALQNTRLLKAYADMHPRVRELGIAVKLWAKAAQVCGASRRHLSSYTFTLLTIYFMQVSPDVQMPYLPTSCFEPGGEGEEDPRVQAARSSFTCQLSTAELLVNFFLFYNLYFAWGYEVVSTRLGSRHQAQEQMFESLRGKFVRRLHIEDPYVLDRNLHCVLGEDEEVQLRCAFAEGLQALQFGQSPVGLVPLSANKASWADVSAEAEAEALAEAETEDRSTEEEAKFNEEDYSKKKRGSRTSSGLSGGTDSTVYGAGCLEAWGEDEAGDSSAGESRVVGAASSDEHAEAVAQNWQWWRHLGSASVAEAVDYSLTPTVQPRKPKGSDGKQQKTWLNVSDLEATIRDGPGGQKSSCITVQHLEGMFNEPSGKSKLQPQAMRTGVSELVGIGFAARSTSGIAARVNRLCLAQCQAAVAVV